MADPAREIPDRWLVEEALRSLSSEYAAAVDDRNGDRLADLFVADGSLVVPRFPDDLRPVVTRAGREAIRQVPEGLRRYARTFHQVSNCRFAVDADLATGTVDCVAHHVTAPGGAADSGTDVVWFIRYCDDYRRTESGWRFGRRVLRLQWVEEHPIAVIGTDGTDEGGYDDQVSG